MDDVGGFSSCKMNKTSEISVAGEGIMKCQIIQS
jgi:hypothetical protein